jgi:hypothetical protein
VNKIKLAIDLDNTIINYDDLFYKVAKNKLSIQSNIKSKETLLKDIPKIGPVLSKRIYHYLFDDGTDGTTES